MLKLPDELESFRQAVRAQATARVAPLAATVDREQQYSPELWAAVRDLELLQLPFTEAGLRVMDCSVLPTMVAGNLNGPMMAMASVAADVIRDGG